MLMVRKIISRSNPDVAGIFRLETKPLPRMPTRRSSQKRSARPGRERDPAQVELPLDALQQQIHDVLSAELGAPVALQPEVLVPKEMPVALCEPPTAPPEEPAPLMPVRRLQNYAYCPRLFYYQWVENLFEENADTAEGSAAHRQTDKPSALPEDPKELELPEGARLRSLQLESETLGLVGKIDVCEGTGDGIEVIDHKKGSAAARREWRARGEGIRRGAGGGVCAPAS